MGHPMARSWARAGHLLQYRDVLTGAGAASPALPDPPAGDARCLTNRLVAQQLIGDVAPKLAELTDEVLFGDVWERPGLSKRDRSLITVATLVALNRTEQLPGHLKRAIDNGLTKDELVEAITHLAFYSGWPTAMSAAGIVKKVLPAEG